MAYNATRVTADAMVVTPTTNTNAKAKFTAFGFRVLGTGGQYKNVQVVTSRGTVIAYTGLAVGTREDLAICAVTATNTTAAKVVVYVDNQP